MCVYIYIYMYTHTYSLYLALAVGPADWSTAPVLQGNLSRKSRCLVREVQTYPCQMPSQQSVFNKSNNFASDYP